MTELKTGEIKCDKCNGSGIYVKEFEYRVPGEKIMTACDKCCGTGKLDWIEVVVGKKIFDVIWYRPHGYKRGTINEIKTR